LSEEGELEKLKAKRLAEMQKNLSNKQKEESKQSSEQPAPNPREIVKNRLGYRGLEVLEAAEFQFPNEFRIIITKLAELISSGEIDEELDGGKLLTLFRVVGLNVRLQTKINVEKDGKFISLSEKLSTKESDSDV